MDKEGLVRMFSEGLSLEEIPTISNLEDIKGIVESSNLDIKLRNKIIKNINHLIKDTIRHAEIFTNLIDEEAK